MTTTTIEVDRIIVTIHLPKSPSCPLPSPVSEPMNTAAAVDRLYTS